jgi:cytochrome c biogenesis protein CcmG/thiol:disulfide interchange protein DsbE
MTEQTEQTGRKGGFRPWMLIPVLCFAAIGALFIAGLGREDARVLPSALIDKPAPTFDLPPLREGEPGFSTADLKAGDVTVVNIWASWCVPCRIEHPKIEELAGMGVTVHGLNYRDSRANAESFLNELGDPFTLIGFDEKGRQGIEWGVYGVPETFVLTGDGRIVYKHIGPIQNDDLETKVLPAIEKAKAGG